MADKKTNKTTRNVIIGLVVIIAGIFIFKKIKENKDKNNKDEVPPPNTKNSGGSSGSSATALTNQSVLKRGMSNQYVSWAQFEINKVYQQLGIEKLVQDGIFGENTEKAFQKLLGKKTGSQVEVYNKVKSMLGTTVSNDGCPQGKKLTVVQLPNGTTTMACM
jgi:hypothetical protein